MKTIILAVILGLASWSLSYAAEPSAPTKPLQEESGQTNLSMTPGQTEGFKIIRGEVLKMEGNSYLVRDETGKEVRLIVNNDSKITKAFEVGDTIIAQVSDKDVVTVMTKSADAPEKK
jgi:hypothetical protein